MAKTIKKPMKNNECKIPQPQLKVNYDKCTARLAFSSVCNSHCLISEWYDDELITLINCFKNLESKTWLEIKDDNGLNYEPKVKHIDIQRPQTLPPDANLSSLRVNKKSRLYGYRTQDVFNIIWFDKNHVVCPMNKQKKYSV